jgi:peptidyl-prolyl cis-trans isomerase B (cyclophilin B)
MTVPNERIEIRKVTIRDKPAPTPEPFTTETADELSKYRAVIETSLGNMTAQFYPDRAPNTVRNFLRQAQSGVFDGTAFHRVVKGFVIQGGYIPMRTELLDEKQESYVRRLPPEFNATQHEKGTLSMAHGDDPGSATTSFFIVLARTPALDKAYAAFGKVIEGLDVLDKIEATPVNGEAPVTRVDVIRVRVIKP